jgi:aryl-phospho-beta-D-glucosidase BglC (GH1 family)
MKRIRRLVPFTCVAVIALSACPKSKPAVDNPVATSELTATAPVPDAEVAVAAATTEDAQSAAWTIEVGDKGSVRVRYRGTQLLATSYLFWGASYEWADAVVTNLESEGGVTTFALGVDSLGLKIGAKVSKTGPGELTFEYTVNAAKKLDGIVGGGIEWNLKLDGAPSQSEPALLPEQRGFRWPMAGGDGISVSFEPAAASVYFEQNNKNQVRSFLVGKHVEPGSRKIAMKVRLPKGGAVRASVDERYGKDDRGAWYPGVLKPDKWPVDVSFLNERPAGKRGRVKADGERLVFEDGTPVRFWGTNVQAYALFASRKEDIELQAKRLAALGFNLVRLHHHDSEWVTPNVIDKSAGTTQNLDDKALDLLDFWVKCLKEQGIYVWIDLHVGRQFLAGDGINGYGELAREKGSGKGFNYINPRIEKLMQDFATKYLTRQNRYTNKAYTEEPAVMGILITNENDLTDHFGNSFLPDKNNPVHNKIFEALVNDFAKKTGLSVSASMKTWEPGAGKIMLNELEHRFDQRAIDKLRADGAKALIATTNYWGDEGLFSLPALAAGDIVDVHSYGKTEFLGANPRTEANFIDWIGAAQVAGKPLSISEWNLDDNPNRDRFVAPLYLAAIAALQAWDAPMLYGYNQGNFEVPEGTDVWSSWMDPGVLASMPAAALLFRQAHVREAQKTYRLDLSRETLYFADTSPATSATIRTLLEQSKLTIGLPDIPELDWDGAIAKKPAGATAITDVARDFIPPGQNVVTSDTGELKRDFALGVETINTPMSQAMLGWIGGRRYDLADVTFDIRTPKAAVAVTSLDQKPLASSKRMLLTVVAQVASSPGDKLPYLSQPVEGAITFRGDPVQLVPLSPTANPASATPEKLAPFVPSRKDGKEQTFTLTRGVPTHWFLVTR